MKTEYLFFNLLVVLGPLVCSFEQRVHYVSRWGMALLTATLVAIPYTFWDMLVVGRHWTFNPQFTLDIHPGGLPPGEWLFFFTVPFACLFVWESICAYRAPNPRSGLRIARYGFYAGFPAAVIVLIAGREFTAFVALSVAVAALADWAFQTDLLLQPRAYLFLGLVTLLILVCNSYLAGRPIVFYEDAYRLGLRIGAIPIEDFGYGLGLVLLNAVVYEKLKGLRHG